MADPQKGQQRKRKVAAEGPKEVERKRETVIPKAPSGEPSATTRTTEKQTPDNPAFAPDDVTKTTQPIPPASAMRSAADFQARLKSLPPPPKSFSIGEDLNWDAPRIEVTLRVELPFWLMVGNTEISIEVGDHTFPVSIHGESFELHICAISDAKLSSSPSRTLTEARGTKR